MYDEFKALVCELAARDDLTMHGLLPIPILRRETGTRIGRSELDAFLVQMHGEGLVHLLSHVEFENLPLAVQRETLQLPSGLDLYWIRVL
ncbi:MAG: hypothetical protein DMF82_14720 [Acidobacteria bacterium]|nr:MAG: hypothetical protein DMF82_14720 [Acidobacteriota bacterium]